MAPVNRGWLSTSEAPITGSRSDSRRSSCTPRRQPCEAPVSSSEYAPAARSDSGPLAPSRVAGPPWSTVSAALTVSTRSVSTRARLARRGTFPGTSRSTRPGSSASWISTVPRNRRANPGETIPRLSSSRRFGRRVSPEATSSVWRSVGTPTRSSSAEAAASATCRGSCNTPGRGSVGGSTTIVARPPRVTSASSGSPASGNRSASRIAARMSATCSPGGGGRMTTASSGASTTATRVPKSSGSRVT